jgi:hypothetical protein
MFASAAPLLEEEWHVDTHTLISHFANPFWLHRPGMMTAFAAYDDPIDVPQINRTEAFQEGFDGQESYSRSRMPEVGNARDPKFAVFYGHTQPDVVGACEPPVMLGPVSQASRAFGENLVGVLRRSLHHIECLLQETILDEVTKEVTHRVNKYPARGLPGKRLFQPLGAQERIEP